MRRHLALVLLPLLAGCQRLDLDAPAEPAAAVRGAAPAPMCGGDGEPLEPVPDEPLPPCPPGPGTLLARAVRHYDAGEFPLALACAAQAVAADPDNVAALSERAAALVALGRLEEARVVYARALAIDPHHADALLGAADLYLNRLGVSRDFSELGLRYARTGREVARREQDQRLGAQFAVLEANGLNDLGRAREAIRSSEEALATSDAEEPAARYEKAVALWDLCRFAEAEQEFRRLLADRDRAAVAHYHLALIAERRGDHEGAARGFAEARRLRPDHFPEPVEVSAEEFSRIVTQAVLAQPEDVRRDLAGVEVGTQDLPDLEDLVASDPPLSPEIVGLYRGPPLGESCPPPDELSGPCRAIVLYRKNLGRVVRDRAELEEQVRVTIEHEIGHLRGEDDVQLAARGLE
jgi:tetratricopeptide (TPR) repeat protein